MIYLAEIRIPSKASRTGFRQFALSDADLAKLLAGDTPSFHLQQQEVYPTLVDLPDDRNLIPLRRLACKMATGSGKTVVMAMLIAWAFCNRGRNPRSREFPNAVLVCCPNLTVKERLQVLRPEHPNNYYEAFELIPSKFRPLMQAGKVLVTNWHAFAPESEHKEGDRSYAVVNKGEETPEVFARNRLGEMFERMPIMVLNDEGHHCWRPAPNEEELIGEEKGEVEAERQEARIWLDGLDTLNNARSRDKPGILFCVDLSATPFYITGSGHPEKRPFPWIVSDFGLVDAIESGIVKIPRLPVLDTTGRPDPKYFRLWRAMNESLTARDRVPGKSRKPKAHVAYREAEGALKQIAGQWLERLALTREATPDQEYVPPVLIVVCDNTDMAQVFYEKISGESETEIVEAADIDQVENGDEPVEHDKKTRKKKTGTVYGPSQLFDEFANTPTRKHTIRIDSKLLEEAESDDPKKNKRTAAEELRRVVGTVGKRGEPGEHVRCVVSVSMLTEGWDANNVTHILGIRAFASQLLCEQVVGRGLRRMDYTPDPGTGLLTEEYVDVYGIPFSVIPFKGRVSGKKAPEDKPKNHVHALEERVNMEIRFPVVEGYAFALRRNLIRCDIDSIQPLQIEPHHEPTATFIRPTIGYQEGHPSHAAPVEFVEQNRAAFYAQMHLQTIQFEITRMVLAELTGSGNGSGNTKSRVLRFVARHQLFPQVYRYVREYVARKVDFQGENPSELGLERYVRRAVERLCEAIVPDDGQNEPPLLPILNRYKRVGTTAEVDFKTTRSCRATKESHINQVVLDTQTWEAAAAFRLEQSKAVECYVRNDRLGFVIPYEFQGLDHSYEPDFLVRLTDGVTVVLEIKGEEDERDRAKHEAARRWVSAVNNWGELGTWAFHVCRNPQMLERELALLPRHA